MQQQAPLPATQQAALMPAQQPVPPPVMSAPPAQFDPVAQNAHFRAPKPAPVTVPRGPKHFRDDEDGPENDLYIGAASNGMSGGQMIERALLHGKRIPSSVHSMGVPNSIPRHGDKPHPELHGADFISALHAGVGSEVWHKRGNEEAFHRGVTAAIRFNHKEQERHEHERYRRDVKERARKQRMLQRVQAALFPDIHNHMWRHHAMEHYKKGVKINQLLGLDAHGNAQSFAKNLIIRVSGGFISKADAMETMLLRYGPAGVSLLTSLLGAPGAALGAMGLAAGHMAVSQQRTQDARSGKPEGWKPEDAGQIGANFAQNLLEGDPEANRWFRYFTVPAAGAALGAAALLV